MDREKLGDHNDMHCMTFALKGKVVKKKKITVVLVVWHYVMQPVSHVVRGNVEVGNLAL